jgi:hypothetical protein
MAVYTDALQTVERIVSTYLFSYKKPTEDYSLYVQHACRAIEDFNLYDGNYVVSAKVTIDATLKCITMPDDMQTFVDLVTPIHGGWWSFTEKNQVVTTTTFTGLVESRVTAEGEGVAIDQYRTTGYGARGAWNKFRYTIDWAARRIYVDDVYTADDYIVLLYVSSGIKAGEDTTVPAFLVPLIEAYLFERETYWVPGLERERPMRHEAYWREKMKVRDLVNSMSYNQWRDLILENVTQTPQR